MEPDEQNLALSQGLLGLGAGLLSGSFGHYGAFGPALGAGVSGFSQGYGNAMKYSLEAQQLKMLKQNYDRQNAMMDMATNFAKSHPEMFGGSTGSSGTPSPAPQLTPGTSTSPYVLSPQAQSIQQTQTSIPQQPADPRVAAAQYQMLLGITKGDPAAIGSANDALYPKGIAQREGAPVVDPFTGREIAPAPPKVPEGFGMKRGANGQYEMFQIPGSDLIAKQAANVAGATKKAQELNQFHNVPQATGAVVPIWGTNVPGAPTSPTDAPTISPTTRTPQAKPMAPNKPGSNADPWTMIPMMETPKGVGQSTYQKGTAENIASIAKSLIEKHGQQASDANTRIAVNDQALGLIEHSDTGPYAARIADVKNLLVSRFGIPESSFENTPSATMVLQKDLVNAATQKAKQQFGSRITQSEVMLMLTRGAPNVDMTKAAMTYLVNSDTAQSKYAIQQATDLGTYIQKGGDPTRFEAWYANNFPLSSAMKKIEMSGKPQPTGAAKPYGVGTSDQNAQETVLPDGKIQWNGYTWPSRETLENYKKATKGNP